METPPPTPLIFDRRLLRRRLARALRGGAPDFLMLRAADDLADRLAGIKRDFPRSLDLCTPAPHFTAAVVASGRAEPLRAGASAAPGVAVVAEEEALPFAPALLRSRRLRPCAAMGQRSARRARPGAPHARAGRAVSGLFSGRREPRRAARRARPGGGGDLRRRQPARLSLRRSARSRRAAATRRLRPAGDRCRLLHAAL